MAEVGVARRAPLLPGLDAVLAAHLSTAMTRYARWRRDVDRPAPAGFVELLTATTRVAKSGQLRRSVGLVGDDARMRTGGLLTVDQASLLAGISTRTLRRHVAAGPPGTSSRPSGARRPTRPARLPPGRMTTDVRAALAELGLVPGDLDPAILDVVAQHLEDHEPSMNDFLRVERDAIPHRRQALRRRIFGVADDPESPSPPPAAA